MRTFLFFVFVFGLCGCVVNPKTGERRFSPMEYISAANEAIPDETKAIALEQLALILGASGAAGAAGVPACMAAAAYFRNRKKKKQSSDTDEKEVKK